MLKLTNEGGLFILDSVFGTDVYMQLFTGPAVLANTDVDNTFAEYAGGGYASKAINTTNVATLVAGIPTLNLGEQVFTFTAPFGSAIYGYQLIDTVSVGTVLVEELLAVPFVPLTNGDTLKITPIVTCYNGLPG